MSDVQIAMARPNLDDLAPAVIPEGYRLRTAADFDDPIPVWIAAINNSFENTTWTPEWVREQFTDREQYDPHGVFFAMYGDTPVSTAFAWIDDPCEKVTGRVHYVGTVAAHRGKGLARAMVLTVLHHLRGQGLQRAMLGTQPYRLPAISVYLKLGFEPEPGDDPVQQEAWRQVMEQLAAR